MKIKAAIVNNKKKCLQIETSNHTFHLPFVKLRLQPTATNKITNILVDPELAREAVTYQLESGEEDSISVDAFLDYNKDADFMIQATLYQLTLTALKLVKSAQLGKREIARKLQTSPAQLYRLLDTTNTKKTLDQMFKLIHHLGGNLNVSMFENDHPL